MKLHYQDIKQVFPKLQWSAEELAEKLSLIGFETELEGEHLLNVTLLSNRKDCQNPDHLLFDLAGIYDLKAIRQLANPTPGRVINVTLTQINKLLGTDIQAEQYAQLNRLGFLVEADSVTVPSFRQDIQEKADVAEELLRLVGYKVLKLEPLSPQTAPESDVYQHIAIIKLALSTCLDGKELGLTEALSSSFTPSGKIKLKNPFTQDEPYLRADLQAGLLKTVAKNPYIKQAGYFEIGQVFLPEEETNLGIILCGIKDIDPITNKLSLALGQPVSFEPIAPEEAEKCGVKHSRLWYMELPIEGIKVSVQDPQKLNVKLPSYESISKYPPLVRNVTVDSKSASSPDILAKLPKQLIDQLLICELIDVYNPPSAAEAVSTVRLTYRLIFQKHSSSYTEAEIGHVDQQLSGISSDSN